MTMPEPTVYVVDDDPAVRDSLEWLLTSVNLAVRSFASALDFLDADLPDAPGCLVLDVRMPGMSGLDLQEEMATRSIDLPVVLVTGHGDVHTAVRAMKAGAFDFIEKPFSDQALLEIIQKAVEGSVTAAHRRVERNGIQCRLDLLTPRERDILDEIVDGQSNKQIAARLGMGKRTVEAHRARVMEKMKARSLADLVNMAVTVEFQDQLRQLSGRERQVLQEIVAGQSNKRIAFDLKLSEKTVEVYRARVMKKMKAKSLVDLVKKAMKMNLDRGSP